MSWDVDLIGVAPVRSWNFTYNLGPHFRRAGNHPSEWRGLQASVLAELLKDTAATILADYDEFVALDPENGWGSTDHLLEQLTEWIRDCEAHPSATVEIS